MESINVNDGLSFTALEDTARLALLSVAATAKLRSTRVTGLGQAGVQVKLRAARSDRVRRWARCTGRVSESEVWCIFSS